MDHRDGHQHAGDLGEVTQGWDSDFTSPPTKAHIPGVSTGDSLVHGGGGVSYEDDLQSYPQVKEDDRKTSKKEHPKILDVKKVEEQIKTPVEDAPVVRASPPLYPEVDNLPPAQEDSLVVPDTTLEVPLGGIPADVRAGNNTEHLDSNKTEEDKTFDNTPQRGITINGKNFMDIMRQKKTAGKMKTTQNRKTTPGRKKTISSPAPSSVVDIRKFLTDKIVKKTFNTVVQPRNTVSDKIEKFQKIVADSNGGCILGSGMCATHNEKLVRQTDMKRICENDDRDGVRWVQRDVTRMVCPKATKVCLQRSSEPEPVISTQGGPTNKKPRNSLLSDNNQSASRGRK